MHRPGDPLCEFGGGEGLWTHRTGSGAPFVDSVGLGRYTTGLGTPSVNVGLEAASVEWNQGHFRELGTKTWGELL